VVKPELIGNDWRTTLMIRNIPNKYTVNELAHEIDSEHPNTYDFLYLPCDPKVPAPHSEQLQRGLRLHQFPEH
jgi:hypothetical protein